MRMLAAHRSRAHLAYTLKERKRRASVELKLHYAARPGFTQLITPRVQPVAELDFGLLLLEPGREHALERRASQETGLVILRGTCDVTVDGERYGGLGGRETVFDGRATGLYAPPGAAIGVRAGEGGVELAVCRAWAEARHPVQVVRPEDVMAREVGGPGFLRYVHDILGPQISAGRLLIGETFTVAGNWSSFPPHKHDIEALPDEVRQEELYLYKVRPAGGFGIQYLYSDADSPRGPLEAPQVVRENDLTLMPFGYHPVAAPPGYDIYYLWFLAGPTRLMRPHDDPRHAWIKEGESVARSYPR